MSDENKNQTFDECGHIAKETECPVCNECLVCGCECYHKKLRPNPGFFVNAECPTCNHPLGSTEVTKELSVLSESHELASDYTRNNLGKKCPKCNNIVGHGLRVSVIEIDMTGKVEMRKVPGPHDSNECAMCDQESSCPHKKIDIKCPCGCGKVLRNRLLEEEDYPECLKCHAHGFTQCLYLVPNNDEKTNEKWRFTLAFCKDHTGYDKYMIEAEKKIDVDLILKQVAKHIIMHCETNNCPYRHDCLENLTLCASQITSGFNSIEDKVEKASVKGISEMLGGANVQLINIGGHDGQTVTQDMVNMVDLGSLMESQSREKKDQKENDEVDKSYQ